MPPTVLDTIRLLEKKGEYNNPKYMELLLPNFYAKHIIRLPEMARTLNKNVFQIK